MSSRMRFPPAHHTSIEQTSEIRTLAQSGVSRMIMSWMKRSEVQVSEITPPIFPQLLGKLGNNGAEEPESRGQKQKPNLKTGTAETSGAGN